MDKQMPTNTFKVYEKLAKLTNLDAMVDATKSCGKGGTVIDLETRKQQLLEELAKVEAEIEAAKFKSVFLEGDYAYIPTICGLGYTGINSYDCTLTDEECNSTGIFMFKTKERCESFNKKLLELGERQALIEYGKEAIPTPCTIQCKFVLGFSGAGSFYFTADGKYTVLEKCDLEDILKFCNQGLDHLEQKELHENL